MGEKKSKQEHKRKKGKEKEYHLAWWKLWWLRMVRWEKTGLDRIIELLGQILSKHKKAHSKKEVFGSSWAATGWSSAKTKN